MGGGGGTMKGLLHERKSNSNLPGDPKALELVPHNQVNVPGLIGDSDPVSLVH